MTSARETSASLAMAAQQPPAHDALLERYLHLLRADPDLLAAAAHLGRENTLQWAADELRHTAATLPGVSLEDAEFELRRVVQEARERLGLTAGSQGEGPAQPRPASGGDAPPPAGPHP